MKFLIFLLDDGHFGFNLLLIERVISVVEVTPLPHAPSYLLGAINVHGKILPVINLREILGFKLRDFELSDQFLICKINNKLIGLWVDQVKGIVAYPHEQLLPAKQVFPNLNTLEFVVKNEGGMVLLYDLKKLLEEANFYDPISS